MISTNNGRMTDFYLSGCRGNIFGQSLNDAERS